MYLYSRIVLTVAGVCMGLGGLYDVFTPRLPPSLQAACGASPDASRTMRELLRALGGALIGVGVGVALLARRLGSGDAVETLALVALLVLPSEGVNAFAMRRARSPYWIALIFIAMTMLGVGLALLRW